MLNEKREETVNNRHDRFKNPIGQCPRRYNPRGTVIMRMLIISFLLFFFASLPLSAQGQDYTDWMKSSALTAKLHKMEEDRLFPGTVEGRLEGTEILYRAQFIPFLLNLAYFESRWGLSDVWYKANTERLTKAGYTEYSHTTFTDQSGNTVHQATWVLIK